MPLGLGPAPLADAPQRRDGWGPLSRDVGAPYAGRRVVSPVHLVGRTPDGPVSGRGDAAPEIVAALRSVCLGLPGAYEEDAWVGTRWRVRQRTFAHVVAIDAGWPPAYARAAGTAGPATVLTFRSAGDEREALRGVGHPFFLPPWAPGAAGMVLEAGVDWDEVAELVTESYRVMAPRTLADMVDPRTR